VPLPRAAHYELIVCYKEFATPTLQSEVDLRSFFFFFRRFFSHVTAFPATAIYVHGLP